MVSSKIQSSTTVFNVPSEKKLHQIVFKIHLFNTKYTPKLLTYLLTYIAWDLLIWSTTLLLNAHYLVLNLNCVLISLLVRIVWSLY